MSDVDYGEAYYGFDSVKETARNLRAQEKHRKLILGPRESCGCLRDEAREAFTYHVPDSVSENLDLRIFNEQEAWQDYKDCPETGAQCEPT